MSILHHDLEWLCKAKRKRYKQIKKTVHMLWKRRYVQSEQCLWMKRSEVNEKAC